MRQGWNNKAYGKMSTKHDQTEQNNEIPDTVYISFVKVNTRNTNHVREITPIFACWRVASTDF